MAVSLQKGQNVSLSKAAPGMKKVRFGLGWDARATDGAAFDLDASAFVLDASGKVLSDQHFVFYNNPHDPSGAIAHKGDNRTGQGGGDDEVLEIDLGLMTPNAAKVTFVVTIHDAEARKQSFGQVSNAYIRALNAEGELELARYDLSEDASIETAMIFGELYRNNDEWKFKAIGQGYAGGLVAVARDYGVSLG
ncbi:TerD family protein [Candidatus Contendibacter odensensis]|uniref:Tellurium resistance protein n=1 Tax=Candidatus Contendobacter odensis Run_B_J11 TaxID=1400861 RepID=A0A7U7G9N1_9GAMM|nr:TerD family protein [Candidatus Contendobacter odensis]CDH44492.1 tellurium resistance protein [Candidatus Contendobacter odensis Run_B_J11]